MTWKERLGRKRHETALTLNQANVALAAGNFDLATDFARQILETKHLRKISYQHARLLLIQTKTFQGFFSGVFDDLESLFAEIPQAESEFQARVGNEIIRACFRSGNLSLGAGRGEELLREFSSNWPEVEVVELLCQLSSCHFHRGDVTRAEETVGRALGLAEKIKSHKALTQSLWQSSALKIHGGDLTIALQQVQEANAWARLGGLDHITPKLNSNAALILLNHPEADLTEVHRLAESAYLELLSQNNPGGAAYACEILSDVSLRREDYETALIHAKRGLNDLPIELPGPRASLLVQVAKVLARMGRFEESNVELAQAFKHMEELEPSTELARQWGDLARVYVEVGLTDRGVYAYEKAIQMSGLLREEQDSFVD